jgi:hypothetical protein
VATPPFQSWLKDAAATLAADMVKVDDRPGPWMLGYRIGLAGWMVSAPGPGFVEYVRDLARKMQK